MPRTKSPQTVFVRLDAETKPALKIIVDRMRSMGVQLSRPDAARLAMLRTARQLEIDAL